MTVTNKTCPRFLDLAVEIERVSRYLEGTQNDVYIWLQVYTSGKWLLRYGDMVEDNVESDWGVVSVTGKCNQVKSITLAKELIRQVSE